MDRSIDAIESPPAADSAVAVGAAITSMIPLVGGALAATLQAWRQYVATGRLSDALREIRAAIQAVQDKIDYHFAESRECRDAWDWVLESATQARNADKLRFYAAALARTITSERPLESERSLMLDTLDRLRSVHLAILAAIASDPRPPYAAGVYLDGVSVSSGYLTSEVPGLASPVLARCWEDLALLQLVAPVSTMTVEYGSAPQKGAPTRPIVTSFGRRFLDFISPVV